LEVVYFVNKYLKGKCLVSAMLSKEVTAPVVMNADSPTLPVVKHPKVVIHPSTDLLVTVIEEDMVEEEEEDTPLVDLEFATHSRETSANVVKAAATATPLEELPVVTRRLHQAIPALLAL